MASAPAVGISQATKLWYLKRFPLFDGFSNQEMDEVQRLSQSRTYRKGETLYLPGEPSGHLFMLKRGVIKLSRLLPDGRELTLTLLKPGDVFGELEVVGDTPHDAQAVAYEDVLLCVMARRDLLRWMQRKPELSLRITKLTGFRLRTIEHRLERLLFRSAPAKLADLLVELARQFGRRDGSGLLIDLPLTHQELANLTGSVRETVSGVLAQFRQQGWIVIEHRRIRMLDPNALRRAAQESV